MNLLVNDRKEYKKIAFYLEQDDEGYPPCNVETLWVTEIEPGLYRIDNIPFYVQGISFKDIVSVEEVEDEIYFKQLVTPSGHSVLHVVVFDESKIDVLLKTLKHMSCDIEQSNIPILFSVDIPESIDIQPIIDFLQQGQDSGFWEYSEASLRHQKKLLQDNG
jgi:hypothetical protein